MSWQNLSLLPTIISDLQVGLSSDRRPVLGIIYYRNCHQLFLHWRLKFVIKWSYMIFVSSEKFKIHTTRHWSPRRIGPLDFPNEFIKFSLWLGIFSNVIKKIHEIINFNESTCDIYTMDYISQSPTHFSERNLGCVLQYTKFTYKKTNGYVFQKNCSWIK